jgi:hypothetical protein
MECQRIDIAGASGDGNTVFVLDTIIERRSGAVGSISYLILSTNACTTIYPLYNPVYEQGLS